MGTTGDCWDRFKVRIDEIKESVRIMEQCLSRLQKELKRTPDFDPRAMAPKKCFPKHKEYYVRGESPKGELGFYFIARERSEIPFRCKARGPSPPPLPPLPQLTPPPLIPALVPPPARPSPRPPSPPPSPP